MHHSVTRYIFLRQKRFFIMFWYLLFCLQILSCTTTSGNEVNTMKGFEYEHKIEQHLVFFNILLLILMQRAAPHHNCFNHKRSGWYLLKSWCFCYNWISFSMFSFWQICLECLIIIESKIRIKRFQCVKYKIKVECRLFKKQPSYFPLLSWKHIVLRNSLIV